MNAKKIIFIAALITITTVVASALTPEQLKELKKRRFEHFSTIYTTRVEQLGSRPPTLNTYQRKVSGLIQVITYDLFLEIEHACLKNFDFDFCKLALDTIISKFTQMNVLLQEDYEFLQAAIETVMISDFMNPLYNVLLENNLIDQAFANAAALKAEIEMQFKK